jgi:hypothetical protein
MKSKKKERENKKRGRIPRVKGVDLVKLKGVDSKKMGEERERE